MNTLVGAEILTEEARAFVTRLHRELNPVRLELLNGDDHSAAVNVRYHPVATR